MWRKEAANVYVPAEKELAQPTFGPWMVTSNSRRRRSVVRNDLGPGRDDSDAISSNLEQPQSMVANAKVTVHGSRFGVLDVEATENDQAFSMKELQERLKHVPDMGLGV